MVVEENEDVGEVFKAYLELFDFDVIVKTSPPEAFRLSQSEYFDAYVIDIGMENFAAIELARKLRSMPDNLRPAKLIATTAYADDERENCLAAGFDAFFIKPIDAEKIVEEIRGGSLKNSNLRRREAGSF